jgi:hypothetical protein
MESTKICRFCLGEFDASELILCLHCDKKFCKECISPCKIHLRKTLGPNDEKLTPLIKCDFCMVQFTDYQLIRCHQCMQVFCQKCTFRPCSVRFNKECGERELIMHYCTPKCREESGILAAICPDYF